MSNLILKQYQHGWDWSLHIPQHITIKKRPWQIRYKGCDPMDRDKNGNGYLWCDICNESNYLD